MFCVRPCPTIIQWKELLGLNNRFTLHNTDVNECEDDTRTCHNCRNFVGGFDCGCNDGYYHSPAAQTCYGEPKFFVIQ